MTKIKAILVTLLIFTAVFIPISYVSARAGGGQNYSSGSSSSSSSSSGSSSSSSGGSIFGFFSIIPIAILIIIVFFVIKNKKNKGGTTSAQNPNASQVVNDPIGSLIGAALGGITGAATPATNDVQSKIDQIKQTDPAFNEQIFKDKAQNAFFKIQEAWEKQDVNIARPFVSDSIMQRYSTQISDLKSRGEKNVLENIVIGNTNIVEVRSDNAYNYIKLQIDASCADYTVDNKGKMISGSKSINGFTEYWTFIRTVNTVTDANKQLKDNKCPNCGAPLEVNATGQCNYCSAVISSGQYDWVLSEINQA